MSIQFVLPATRDETQETTASQHHRAGLGLLRRSAWGMPSTPSRGAPMRRSNRTLERSSSDVWAAARTWLASVSWLTMARMRSVV